MFIFRLINSIQIINYKDHDEECPQLHRYNTPTTLTYTLREEILAGRKFGGFGGFCPKPPN